MVVMKEKLLHPSSKALVIHAYLLAAFTAVVAFIFVPAKGSVAAIVLLCVLALPLVAAYIGYLFYGVVDYFLNRVKKAKKLEMAKTFFRKNAMVRKVIGTFFGSLINFLMAIVYFVIGAVNGTFFYVLIGILHLLAFSSRINLLFLGIDPTAEKQKKGLLFSSIFCFLIGLAALGVTLYVYLGDGNFQANGFLIFMIAFFTFLKVFGAIRGYLKARKKQSLLLVGYAGISLSLALFSVFVLQVELINAFGNNNQVPFAWSGIILCLAILGVGVLGIVTAYRVKLPEPQEEPEEIPLQ